MPGPHLYVALVVGADAKIAELSSYTKVTGDFLKLCNGNMAPILGSLCHFPIKNFEKSLVIF